MCKVTTFNRKELFMSKVLNKVEFAVKFTAACLLISLSFIYWMIQAGSEFIGNQLLYLAGYCNDDVTDEAAEVIVHFGNRFNKVTGNRGRYFR